MNNQLVSKEVAKLAKEKGFKEECFYAYAAVMDEEDIVLECSFDMNGHFQFSVEDIASAEENGYPAWFAPYKSELQEWLREEHNLHIHVFTAHGAGHTAWGVCIYNLLEGENSDMSKYELYNSVIAKSFKEDYPTALDVGLLEALKLIKDV